MKIEQMKRPRIKLYAFSVTMPWGDTTQHELLEVIEWVILNIGSVTEKTWDLRGLGTNQLNIYFDDEKDSMAFKLRWM